MNDVPSGYSEAELIQGLRDLASDLGEKPTQKQMRLEGPYSINAYKRVFGSWNDALAAGGYQPRTDHQKITQSELLNSLEQLADELDRSPSQTDINEHSKHSHKTYYREFEGGLEEAKRRVGLEHYEKPSKNRIEVPCENCGTIIEKTPSELSLSEFSYCSQECHYSHKEERYAGRGNPQSTLEMVSCDACGTGIDRPKWKRELNERHYCQECWGDAKVPLECERCGDLTKVWPSVVDKRRFCSTDCASEWFGEEYSGQNSPRWRGGYEEYYGPNWRRQRRRAIIRDQARCSDCGLTEAESQEQFGEQLSVHHIAPVREYIDGDKLDHEQANRLQNLVTLCRPCHSARETEAAYTDY